MIGVDVTGHRGDEMVKSHQPNAYADSIWGCLCVNLENEVETKC